MVVREARRECAIFGFTVKCNVLTGNDPAPPPAPLNAPNVEDDIFVWQATERARMHFCGVRNKKTTDKFSEISLDATF